MSEWNVQRVLLVGYSFGAGVLPFLVNRLPTDVLARIRSVALLGLSEAAVFEFRLADWLGAGGDSRYATPPEVERLRVPIVCVRGADESDSVCRALKGPHVTSVDVGRGHHFSGEYDRLASVILESQR